MKRRKNSKLTARKTTFDKYELYVNSVQSAEHDATLLLRMYRNAISTRGKKRVTLREDFCGTAALCFSWINLGKEFKAIGVDIDQSAIDWGCARYDSSRAVRESGRLQLSCADVMEFNPYRADIICALNFSYYFIKDRQQLIQYFKLCRKRLTKTGLLILDSFGGPTYLAPHSDKRRNHQKKFDFWWDVESFDAITNEVKTHIHYKLDGQKIRKCVFSYDWRLWTIPEITDALREAGFNTIEYWAEGVNARGLGNGVFRKIRSEKNCESWVTYVTAR